MVESSSFLLLHCCRCFAADCCLVPASSRPFYVDIHALVCVMYEDALQQPPLTASSTALCSRTMTTPCPSPSSRQWCVNEAARQ